MRRSKKEIYSIYKATNTINGKKYIGFDSCWPNRKSAHLRSAKKNSNFLFHSAIRKYGPDVFEWEVICQSKNGQHLLNEMETYFIKEYNSFYLTGHGYNMTLGGEGQLGYRSSDETNQKIRQKLKGRKRAPFSVEWKQKMSESRMGLLLSEETKQKISQAHEGMCLSEESKQKISKANTGRKHGPRPDDVKEKLRKKMIGRVFSEETRKRMSDARKCRAPWNKGQTCGPLPEETRRKMSMSHKNRNKKES